jgi:enoyl-CoA hydratase
MFNKKSYETLLVEQKETTLHITINRPDKLNALAEKVLVELKEVLTILKGDSEYQVRAVLLTGAGDKAFIAGADIKAMSSMTSEEAYAFAGLGQEVSRLFEQVNVPVIACVNGFALGGGCEMAMSCDFIFATESAVFGQPEINLALIPGFGGTQRLVSYVGIARAKELIYTGRNMKAKEAYQCGLVQQLFTDKEEMLSEAKNMADKLAQKSPLILSKCKDVIQKGEFLDIDAGLGVERDAFRDVFETTDTTEGLNAFLEKRTAQFQGR